MLDIITTRRISAAMARIHDACRRAVARRRLANPVVGSVQDVDEFGLSILRPVRATGAAQERLDTLERFDAAMRRLSRPPVADTAEPVAEAAVIPTAPAATCKLVPDDAGITGEL